MIYYIFWLSCGKVLDVSSFDDEESRDRTYYEWVYRDQSRTVSEFDDAQCLNVVK